MESAYRKYSQKCFKIKVHPKLLVSRSENLLRDIGIFGITGAEVTKSGCGVSAYEILRVGYR